MLEDEFIVLSLVLNVVNKEVIWDIMITSLTDLFKKYIFPTLVTDVQHKSSVFFKHLALYLSYDFLQMLLLCVCVWGVTETNTEF